MVYYQRALDRTFAALADPTRRAILAQLASGDRTISELASGFDMSLPAVSKHVRVLQRAKLAAVKRSGRVRSAQLRAEPLRRARDWIERYRRFWESELDLLAAYLEHPSPSEKQWPTQRKLPQAPSSKSGVSSARPDSASSTRGQKRKS